MRASSTVGRSFQAALRLLVLTVVLSAYGRTAQAQCVGDCQGDGSVTINDLILGVNIALGQQPPSACPAFQNAQGQVDIAQLIKGVSSALGGCPSEATATTTATNTATPLATSTDTAAVATSTATPLATSTHTSAVTATSSATHTTAVSTATATQPSASTLTSTATGASTATATATPVSTATPTQSLTASSTATVTETSTTTATATRTTTPTETAIPLGELVAGHVPIVSAGLGSLQAIIAAFVSQENNRTIPMPPASSPLRFGIGGVPMPDVYVCSVDGTTQRICTEMGSDDEKSIHLQLDADFCNVTGASGETEQFNGRISVDSNPSSVGTCNPLAFLSGTYQVGNPGAPEGTAPLDVVFRDTFMERTQTVSAELSGLISIGMPPPPSCLVGTLNLTLQGHISALIGLFSDSPTIDVTFFDTAVTMDMITYNADCVPLSYRLKFNGSASFTLSIPGPALVSGIGEEIITSFDGDFTDLFLTQTMSSGSVTTSISGQMNSSCFASSVQFATLNPLVVGAGDLCPNAGKLSLTSPVGPSTVTYDGKQVNVVEGGSESVFPSCLADELVTCIPQ